MIVFSKKGELAVEELMKFLLVFAIVLVIAAIAKAALGGIDVAQIERWR